MKRSIVVILLSLLAFGSSIAQKRKEKTGDEYFDGRKYAEAIAAYESEMAAKGINLFQQLKLADSYYRLDFLEEAAKWYWKLHKLDTSATTPLLKVHHLNYAARSLLASEQYRDSAGAFLQKRLPNYPRELAENADFNWNLLKSESDQDLKYEFFACNINTEYQEFAPTYYEDRILFSSDRPNLVKDEEANYTGYLDIFVSMRDSTGQVDGARLYEGIPVSAYHNATPFYASSLNSLFYITSNTRRGELEFDESGKNSLSIVSKLLNSDYWIPLMKDLSVSFYYPFYDDLSGRLYFSADVPGSGYGGTDIYFVYTNQGQIMSAPINLGPRVNSPGNEIAPFIFEGSLYFSSDVFYGMGGMDIYRTNIQDAGNFSIPVNLGPGINGPDDDYGLILQEHEDGLLGYFASNRPGGKGKDDIYGFRVDEKPGLKTLTLEGRALKTYNTDVIEGVLIELFDANNSLLDETITDNSGHFRIEIPWEDQVRVRAYKDRHSYFEEVLDKTRLEELANQSYDLRLSHYDDLVTERQNQMVVKLERFYFTKGKIDISAEIARELDKVVEFARLFPKVQLRIECYTDSRGTEAANTRFTQDRANTIKKYLTGKGVVPSQIPEAMGYGESKLVNNCKDGVYCLEILHKQNQRTEFVVINHESLFTP